MVRLGTPSARAALTYSKLRARRNSARTTPTSATQENKQHQPEQDEEAGRQDGGDDQQQIEHRDRRPDFDEALEEKVGPAAEIALHAPAATPITAEHSVRIRPNSTEMRKP